MLAPELVLELHTFHQCLHSSPLKPPGSAGFPEWETQPWWTVKAAAGAGSGPGHLDCGEAGAVGCWGVSSVRGVLEGLFISKAVTNSLSERDCKATLTGSSRLACNTHPFSTLCAPCFGSTAAGSASVSVNQRVYLPRLLPNQVLTTLVHLEHSL